MRAVDFQQKWIGVTLKERSASQEHFIDLCHVLGVDTPATADPDGTFYTFERGAAKLGGGDGWADVWKRGFFAWEYKGKRANLDAAYVQLARYREDLENPPLLVVSDLNRIEIHTNFTGTVKKVYEIDLNSFATAQSQHWLKALFTDPTSLRPNQTVASVTEEAAARFGAIARGLHARGHSPHETAHFLVQLLFCLFAEDVGLLPNNVFTKLIAFGIRVPGEFMKQTTALLEAMASGGAIAFESIPYFNGGLFRTVNVLELSSDEIRILSEASTLDWSSVEPAIFGTLFERSLDPTKRSQLGAHYTSRADIERVIDPVVMTPLRRRWCEVRAQLDEIKIRWDAATTPQTRANRRADYTKVFNGFLEELSAVRILDPACGSGNFLYVAMERLLTLEKDVLTYGANQGLPLGAPSIRPSQVLGLEINEYAQELAQVVIWIGYLQWMLGNGFGYSEPILESLDTIRLQDALLDFSGGKVSEAVWPKADFIVGNPPFLGRKELRGGLGREYVDELFKAFQGHVTRTSNLCCYFFEQARRKIASGESKRAGLLATENIRFQDSRAVLENIKSSGDIFMAWSDEPWILNGAAVRISIIAFDDGTEVARTLNGSTVPNINSDLTSSIDITSANKLRENHGIAFMGLTLSGSFDIPNSIALSMLDQPLNVNGRPNRDVVRPFFNGQDVVGRRRNQWVIDFGAFTPLEEAALYEAPFAYVEEVVKPEREKNSRFAYRQRWWIHAEARSGMRTALDPLERYLATVLVSKHRFFVWIDREIAPANRLIVFARDDDYFLGVLSSRVHELWSLRQGARHGVGNDPTYNNSTCFETFALPWAPGTEPVDDPRVIAIGDAAKRLNELRENWLNPEGASEAELKKRTLTNLYNARPTWLANAHAALDRAVWAAYGWEDDPAETTNEQILERLLALNLERSAG